MASLTKNKLTPIKRQIYSEANSRQVSEQKQKPNDSFPKKHKTQIYANPYLKKFNLRKINKTENSPKKLQIQSVDAKKGNKIDDEMIQKINNSLQLRKNKKFYSIRVQTENLRNKSVDVMKQSPYANVNKNALFQTIDHQQIQNQTKYKILTRFQQQQVYNLDVSYIGKRRINSIQDFTDNNGDAKVAVQDSIGYRYQIIDILGKGSFGQVFKAYDHNKKQLCALKIIRNQPKFCSQAKVQIKILEHVLRHDEHMKSNVVEMKNAFVFRGHPCLVFQLLHQNLYEFLREFKFKGIPQDLIIRFSIQILQGLVFFKKHNIIHCDLKPQNILLKQQNKTGIKIIDIGSGCFEQKQIYTYIQSRFYRAPQIILGIPYTSAIDIWSLGCIIAELHQGYPLFPGENQNQQMAMFMEVLGVPPTDLLQKGCRSKKFFNQNVPKLKANKKGQILMPNTKKLGQILKTNDEQFIDFLTCCFTWLPQKRITPAKALLHPWIIKGIPQQIRKQHIHHVKINNQL